MNRRTWVLRGLALSAMVTLGAAPILPPLAAGADTPPPKLIRVEEDWVALVRNPDHRIASPQILICLTPDGTFNADFALLEINHASRPDWLAGGIQLQGWKGELNTSIFNAPTDAVLARNYDKVLLTTCIAIGDGHTEYTIKNGRSRTWGRFTSTKPVTVKVPSLRTDLGSYTREASVKNTHVTHGAHRVEMMYQRRVRYYYSDGTSKTDSSYRILHRYHSLVEEMTLAEWEATKTEYNYEQADQ